MDGRKAVGGKLEVKIRVRDPYVTKQVDEVKEKWLVIDHFERNLPPAAAAAAEVIWCLMCIVKISVTDCETQLLKTCCKTSDSLPLKFALKIYNFVRFSVRFILTTVKVVQNTGNTYCRYSCPVIFLFLFTW